MTMPITITMMKTTIITRTATTMKVMMPSNLQPSVLSRARKQYEIRRRSDIGSPEAIRGKSTTKTSTRQLTLKRRRRSRPVPTTTDSTRRHRSVGGQPALDRREESSSITSPLGEKEAIASDFPILSIATSSRRQADTPNVSQKAISSLVNKSALVYPPTVTYVYEPRSIDDLAAPPSKHSATLPTINLMQVAHQFGQLSTTIQQHEGSPECSGEAWYKVKAIVQSLHLSLGMDMND